MRLRRDAVVTQYDNSITSVADTLQMSLFSTF